MLTRIVRGAAAFRTALLARMDPNLRPLEREIRALLRAMPARYDAQPLPDFLAELTPRETDLAGMDERALRELIDAWARLERNHPFGLCLRRSLLRYHFLRRAGVELGIVFGARFRRAAKGQSIAGHAWNTLNGQPYHEQEEDYQGFRAIYHWPPTQSTR
ncbi:MAG: hypothetical protein GXP42_00190 [Chloroflexi bacterium]|nr:hypothetical protein [Chloroflexota bacterium]